MKYIAEFRDKDAAWYIFKRLKAESRHTNQPNNVHITDSTLYIPAEKLETLEYLASKINAQYRRKA